MQLTKRHVSKEKCRKYTIMVIPEKAGYTKTFDLKKKSFSIVVITSITIFLGISSFALYSLGKFHKSKESYDSLEKKYISLKQENLDTLKNIKSLEKTNGFQEKQINEFQDKTEKINKNLSQLMELETKIKVLLNDEGIKKKLSRGGSTKTQGFNIQEDIDLKIANLQNLVDAINKQISVQRKIPSILPCRGIITSYFGNRFHPVAKRYKFHSGVDIANDKGTPIHAAGDGVISFAGRMGGYGNIVIINHENGYESLYGHNSKLLVKEGQVIKKGEEIALMGTTGVSTGNHSHFEVRKNKKPINPFNLVKDLQVNY